MRRGEYGSGYEHDYRHEYGSGIESHNEYGNNHGYRHGYGYSYDRQGFKRGPYGIGHRRSHPGGYDTYD